MKKKMGNTLVVGVLWSRLVRVSFQTVRWPGITDGGRVTMLHVLRVGIARKFAGPQNDSTRFHPCQVR